ncbi:MAG: NAD(+)/NADH kinase [Clostridia bacterium]|nr:NAD(+)/NADH kinase [Clostridia bacterium]
MIAAIEPNLTRAGALKVTADICAQLKKLGIDFVFSRANAALAAQLGGGTSAQFYADCDIVIAVGGDGSIIHSAKYAAAYGKPVLGINAGNVAFMAGLEADELELLDALNTGAYVVDSRMMLSADIIEDHRVIRSVSCLNDAVFARGEGIYLTEMLVECDGVPVNKYRCDGIVIATPTGSTAYSFAAGGPIVEPTLESILLTPVSPYAKSSRCIIFSSDSTVKITPTDAHRAVFLSADGGEAARIPFGAYAVVRKHERYADFIRIKNDKFWSVLDNKIEK